MQNKYGKRHSYRISFVHWYEIVLFWVAWKSFPLWKNQFYHMYFHSIAKFYMSASHFYWKSYKSTCESQKKKSLSCLIKTSLWENFSSLTIFMLFCLFQLFENKKNTKTRSKKVTIYSFTGTQRNRCSTFRVKRTHTVYWQEGLFVTFDGGYLR